MYAAGRPIVTTFPPAELLYIRYLGLHWVDGQLDHTAIPFPRVKKTSVNRGSLSEPEDVLFSETNAYAHWGVLRFFVNEIPTLVETLGAPTYLFWTKHVPLELNYSHTELWSKRAEGTEDFREPSAAIKTLFRIRLAQVLTAERICIPSNDGNGIESAPGGPPVSGDAARAD